MNEVKQSFTDNAVAFFGNIFNLLLTRHGDFISGAIFAFIIAYVFHKFFADRKLEKSYERTIKEKDEFINSLKQIVLERMSKVDVAEKDASFFKRLKKIFK